MKSFDLGRSALSSCAVLALLAGCGGSQPPIGAPGGMSQSRAIATQAGDGRSWMLPEAKKENLLYVVDKGANDVFVYSYPKRKLVGTLSLHVPTGDCVDRAGNIWIDIGETSGPPAIQEYAHGGTTAISTLYFPDDGDDQTSCSVDRTTGNLAATSFFGTVYIYIKAEGVAQTYAGPAWNSDEYCVYDDSGDLYVDGTMGNPFYPRTTLFELKKDQQRYRRLWFHPGIHFTFYPGGIQWSDNQLIFGDVNSGSSESLVYHVRAHGRSVTLSRTTVLNLDGRVYQFWIQGKTLIAPYYTSGGGGVAFFNYPAGGNPISTITGLEQPVAAAVSLVR